MQEYNIDKFCGIFQCSCLKAQSMDDKMVFNDKDTTQDKVNLFGPMFNVKIKNFSRQESHQSGRSSAGISHMLRQRAQSSKEPSQSQSSLSKEVSRAYSLALRENKDLLNPPKQDVKTLRNEKSITVQKFLSLKNKQYMKAQNKEDVPLYNHNNQQYLQNADLKDSQFSERQLSNISIQQVRKGHANESKSFQGCTTPFQSKPYRNSYNAHIQENIIEGQHKQISAKSIEMHGKLDSGDSDSPSKRYHDHASSNDEKYGVYDQSSLKDDSAYGKGKKVSSLRKRLEESKHFSCLFEGTQLQQYDESASITIGDSGSFYNTESNIDNLSQPSISFLSYRDSFAPLSQNTSIGQEISRDSQQISTPQMQKKQQSLQYSAKQQYQIVDCKGERQKLQPQKRQEKGQQQLLQVPQSSSKVAKIDTNSTMQRSTTLMSKNSSIVSLSKKTLIQNYLARGNSISRLKSNLSDSNASFHESLLDTDTLMNELYPFKFYELSKDKEIDSFSQSGKENELVFGH